MPPEKCFKLYFCLKHSKRTTPEGREEVPLSSSQCGLLLPKNVFHSQNCPFIFQKCAFVSWNYPFVFQKWLFTSQKCSTVFQNLPLVFHQARFFPRMLFFQLTVPSHECCSEQRDNVCLAFVLFPTWTIYWCVTKFYVLKNFAYGKNLSLYVLPHLFQKGKLNPPSVCY